MNKLLYNLKVELYKIKKYFTGEINTRTELINYLIKKNKLKSYLEIGVGYGYNFRKVKCKIKEGCDPYISKNDGYNYELIKYNMPSDEMFKQMKDDIKYDIIFIDGLHEATQVLKDINNSLRHLNDRGYILIHDSIPRCKEVALYPRGNHKIWNGTVYNSYPALLKHNIKFIIVNIDEGIGIIKGGQIIKDKIWENYIEYSYEEIFNSNFDWKTQFNVMNIKQFKDYVKVKRKGIK